MIDFLCWIQALIEVRLALCVGPQHVPVVAICAHETVEFQNESDELWLTLQHLVEAQRGLVLLLMCCSLHWEIGLLSADVLNSFDKWFVYFNHASIFALHHFKNFEFDEVVVAQAVILLHFDQGLLLVIIVGRMCGVDYFWRLISCLMVTMSIPMTTMWLLLVALVDWASCDYVKKLSKNGHQLCLCIHLLPLFAEHQDSFIRDQRCCARYTAEQNVDALPALSLRNLLELQLH